MDPRAALTRPSAQTESAVVADQAVFTSLRSPTGNGYRLIAASRGISADERKEIIRTAPSHNSLHDGADGARALASFVLQSGRRCLYLSRNAGREYSGRGGCRVCTHVLVTDADGYRRFACNPLAIEAATWDAVGDAPARTAGGSLKPLELRPASTGSPAWRVENAPPPTAVTQRMERLLAAVRGGGRLLVAHAPAQREMLCWLLSALPVALREPLSVSYGIRFAPSRRYQVMLAEVHSVSVDAEVTAEGIRVFDWRSPAAVDDADVEAWAGLVRRQDPLAGPPGVWGPDDSDPRGVGGRGQNNAGPAQADRPAGIGWAASALAGLPPGRRRLG